MRFHDVNGKSVVALPILGIEHRFAAVDGGKTTYSLTHAYAEESAEVIAAEPENVTNWLMLADRLEEEGNNTHIIIRFLFIPGYELPANVKYVRIRRGGSYWHNGGTYNEGNLYSYERLNGGWAKHGYTSYGATQSIVEPEEIKAGLMKTGGDKVKVWKDLEITIRVEPRAFLIPAGTKVDVKQVSKDGKNYPTTKGYVTKEEIVLENTDKTSVNFGWITGVHKGFAVQVMAYQVETLA